MKILLKACWFVWGISAIAFFSFSWLVHENYFPKNVTIKSQSFVIVKNSHNETIDYEVIEKNNSQVFFKFSGSTDLLCDNPLLLKYDVDEDGYKDLYFASCGGHQYYRVEGVNTPELVDLGQYEGGPDSLDSWHFNRLRVAFFKEIIITILMFIISSVFLIIVRKKIKYTPRVDTHARTH